MRKSIKALLLVGVLVAAVAGPANATPPFDLTLGGPAEFVPGQALSGPFTGTLTATGVGVPNQTIELFVDNQFAATAATTLQGAYAISLPPFTGTADKTVRAVAFGGTPLETSATLVVEVVRYTLTVSTDGTGTGTVTSSPGAITCPGTCSEEFAATTSIELTTVAGVGSIFTGWSGGGCSGSGNCSVAMNANTSVTATFTLAVHQLSVVRVGPGSGSVFSSPGGIGCGSDCSEDFFVGTPVSLFASPMPGSAFAGWSGGGCTGTGSCTVTMNAPITVTATFILQTFTLNVSRAGNGNGTVTSAPAGINCGVDCSENYTAGSVVSLNAAPSMGSNFAGWSGGSCSGTGTCNITMSAVTSVTATFVLQAFPLSVSRSGTGSGTVTSSPAGISCGGDCNENYNYGTMVTLSATPTAGSVFSGWGGGGCSGTGTCTVSMVNSLSVNATFTLQTFLLSVTKGGSGNGTVTSSPAGISCGVDCNEVYNYGTTVTLFASPTFPSTFTGWSGACSGSGSCVVSMVSARSVMAVFS